MKRMVDIGDFPPQRACLDVAEGHRPLVNVLNGLVASFFVDSITCRRDVYLPKDVVNLRIGTKDLTELLGASHVMGLSVQVTTRNKRDPRLVRENHPLVAHPLEHELAPQRFEVQKVPIEHGVEYFLLVLDHVSLLPIPCTDRVERTTVHGLACPLFDYEVHFQRQLLDHASQRLHLLPSSLHIPSLSLHLIVPTSGTLGCAWFAVPRGFRRLRLLIEKETAKLSQIVHTTKVRTYVGTLLSDLKRFHHHHVYLRNGLNLVATTLGKTPSALCCIFTPFSLNS
ncbi:hypothetical protein PsorP6_015007 [Peronosclerospora sorghi]|uniref:Uncharacterized protein n=1 Tax=Peronosclerospora sorghi TaxID=230839 RepID=A0ACC0VUM6_9STRA|nr:hypothetical protein PsorP6_015007 [Peronosclerospora sorghi]